MRYDFLLFDADNTLFDFTECERRAFSEALKLREIEEKPGMVQVYSAYNDRCWKELERGEVTKQELVVKRYRLFLEHYGIEKDPAVLNETYENCLAHTVVLLPGAYEMVGRLSQKAGVYIVTNGLTHVQRGRFALTELTKFIREIFISEQMETKKPDALFFEKVAAAIPGYDKKRAVVIGDSLTSDMRGANNAGLDCVWYNPDKRPLTEELRITHISSDFADLEAYLTGDDV